MTQFWYCSNTEVISQSEISQGIEARNPVFHNDRLVAVADDGVAALDLLLHISKR